MKKGKNGYFTWVMIDGQIAESIELKKQILKSYDDAIDDINSQFMTLSASERNEETEDYYSKIRNLGKMINSILNL